MRTYFFFDARFEAFNGLIFWMTSLALLSMCVAEGHTPTTHFAAGSGYSIQYFIEEYSTHLLHPSHCSTMEWQLPPLKLHPFFVMKTHSKPSLTV
jgi:hypothetical protein